MANTEKLYDGPCVQLILTPQGFHEFIFDCKGESVNTFSTAMLTDLRSAFEKVQKAPNLKGLIISTAKDAFILGANIPEFTEHFKKDQDEFVRWIRSTQDLFSAIEDLPVPTVSLIAGFALGGGCEVALSTTYRIAAKKSKIGLPETKLGIFPGWGGTVRLSRLAGPDTAAEWIAGGKHYSAEDALKVGAIDAVVELAKLKDAGIALLEQALAGKLDWKARNTLKKSPLQLSKMESTMSFETAKAFIAAQAGPNYPAPLAAVQVMEKGARLSRDEAMQIEAEGFVKMAKSPQAAALTSLFLADQYLKKLAKKAAPQAAPVKNAGVLGAGIMGGGIAYQSAVSKIPAIMKDIREPALQLGLQEASKLLSKSVERGKLSPGQMAETLSRIRATLSFDELKEVDIVVEAVVENEKIKSGVLAELEKQVKPGTILTSNTSTISITRLAQALQHPENFCGMHFFNPVHKMPLVEVIRGEKSSEKAIATTVAYAAAMGKTPVVVNDCPGFLVNRVLFPYFGGFMHLLREGAHFQRVDRVMEKFGWPMGPAYLLDVVGIDTAHHAQSVMSEGFPDRMKYDFKNAMGVLYEAQRYGQKNGKGFYTYTTDPKGKPVKSIDPSIESILQSAAGSRQEHTDEEIIERIMLPMIFECSRCLEEKIVQSPTEVDISLIYGLGFPPFRGGAMRYADSLGASALVKAAEKYKHLGKIYEPTRQIQEFAKNNKGFYV